MRNSIQHHNNSNLTFSCSNCDLGQVMLQRLVHNGAKPESAIKHLDEFAPSEGQLLITNETISHNSLMILAYDSIVSLCNILKK